MFWLKGRQARKDLNNLENPIYRIRSHISRQLLAVTENRYLAVTDLLAVWEADDLVSAAPALILSPPLWILSVPLESIERQTQPRICFPAEFLSQRNDMKEAIWRKGMRMTVYLCYNQQNPMIKNKHINTSSVKLSIDIVRFTCLIFNSCTIAIYYVYLLAASGLTVYSLNLWIFGHESLTLLFKEGCKS